ncbi:MAG: Rid family detoxifying hydrolase [Candidatus Micrarchaeota archaeon]|nr:Rid family detoxifying hydrolase [Candidatus Micrarchaeota archaeon]
MKTRVGDRSHFPISQGVMIDNLLFVSGQIHMKDGKLLDGPIEQQMHVVMENARAVLNAARFSVHDVVKVTIYVTDMSLYDKINEAYRTYFIEPFPAREFVCVKELPAGARLEISMIAVRR